MGRIHVLSEQVANKIAAGEVVERPASVVKELLENALDAGATRIKIQVEGGGKKLIQIVDDGCGMVPDDAMLAFERHATSKIKDAEDLLNIYTLGFRGEALPSIASVSRLRLETRAAEHPSGSLIEIAGGTLLRVEETGMPPGTSITVRDLFFNTPARKKFLKAESTELSHIAQLVTHYALAHPDKHFELHSAANAMLVAAPVREHSERLYQIFGKEVLDQLIPVAAMQSLERVGLPEPPPWRRDEDYEPRVPGEIKLHGFISKPEIQKLNRNSIFTFVNGRLIRDRLIQHALTEGYRNILPPAVYPVVLLFIELPYTEVDANVHPSKTEVRFRQNTFIHDFVRDTVRAALMKARPVPQFTREMHAQPTAAVGFSPTASAAAAQARAESFGAATALDQATALEQGGFALTAPEPPAINERLQFTHEPIEINGNMAVGAAQMPQQQFVAVARNVRSCGGVVPEVEESDGPVALASLKPLGQVRDSFILAVNAEGLWIIDQHVAHERILFEKVLKQRTTSAVEQQRLLMPLVMELTPGQQAIFAELRDELARNGFDAEPFGARTIAVKTCPAGLDPADVEQMLNELLEQFEHEQQAVNLESVRRDIAASIACHAAIKVNMALEQAKMEWLLQELAKCEAPMSCPHGRPVVLRYSVRDLQRAFKRI